MVSEQGIASAVDGLVQRAVLVVAVQIWTTAPLVNIDVGDGEA